MVDRLDVFLFDRLAGHLQIEGDVRAPEDWRFAYAAAYLNSDRPLPLSVSLPLRQQPWQAAVVRNWFGNLLPEGTIREAIAARLRLAVWDDFALLAAIGGECAGAVSIDAEGTIPVTSKLPVESLEQALLSLGQSRGEGSWAMLGAPQRLSLAGAQDKLAVLREPDGTVHLPASGEISTHILKPDSLRMPGLRDLEALGLALARAAGLPVVSAQLLNVVGHPALLIERYDRHAEGGGQAQRLHQEDFCQALGYPGELKYQVSLADCARLLRQTLRLGPRALQDFLDWVIFNVIIGNADAHGKNLALLSDPGGKRRLAPFYDLVPTIALSERLVERKPALAIGDAARIDAINAEHWQQFAHATGYAAGFVRKRVDELAAAVDDKLDATTAVLVAQGARSVMLDKAVRAIRANAQALRAAIR